MSYEDKQTAEVEVAEKKFSSKAKDETILEIFRSWKRESQTYHDYLLKYQKEAEDYYVGKQSQKNKIPAYNSNTVENRIFEFVETIVPLVTANAHHFIALPGSEDEKSAERAKKLQKVLARRYETLHIQEKSEFAVRHLLLFRFGTFKWCWDYDKDDVDVKVIDPRLMLIPKLRIDPHELPYKIEIQEYDKDDFEENFDVKAGEYVKEEVIDVGKPSGGEGKKVFRVYEVWTSETVAWICSNQVLDKKRNPYYDFVGRKRKVSYYTRSGKLKEKFETKFFNHLDFPSDPYVFLTAFNVSDGPVGSTSLAEIGIPLQDDINVQKRQIINNLRRLGNGQVYVDSDSMSKEESDNITDEVGLVIRGEGVASQNKVRREQGVPLPNAHFANLQHSEATFDNIMGIHAATRGAAAAKTLGQDILSRQQDFTRLDLVTRVLNRAIARLANGLVQLMKLFYTKNHVVKILGEKDAAEFVSLNRNEIDDHIEIEVKAGATLPMDKISLRTEAVQLWQLGAIDPVTLYRRLEFPNPEKAAELLLLWKQGTLDQTTLAKVQEMEAGAALQNQFKTSGETETPETGRAVETPQNVLQRATAALGGSAPTLPGIPNLAGQPQR